MGPLGTNFGKILLEFKHSIQGNTLQNVVCDYKISNIAYQGHWLFPVLMDAFCEKYLCLEQTEMVNQWENTGLNEV